MKRLHGVGAQLRAVASSLRARTALPARLRAALPVRRPACPPPTQRGLSTGSKLTAATPVASPSPASASASASALAVASAGAGSGSGSWSDARSGYAKAFGAVGLTLSFLVLHDRARSEAKADDAKAAADDKKAGSKRNPQLYIPPSDEAPISLFSGSGNPALAAEVAMALGIQLGRATVGKFKDGESAIQVHDSVRGRDVFIIQSICGPNPNDRLIELLLLVTAMRRASANRITVVLPYFAYARQANSGMSEQTTIAAADVAQMLEVSGVDAVVTIDVHRPQLQGFFSDKTPVELLDPIKTVAPYFAHRSLASPVIASPVSGGHGVHRATHFQHHLSLHGVDAPLALLYVHDKEGFVDPDAVHHRQILDKPRPAAVSTAATTNPDAVAAAMGEKEYVEVVGDVKGKDVIVVDDMVDTASRMTTAAAALKKAGAKRVFAYATHGLFTGDAIERINNSDIFEIVSFNTVPLPPEKWSVRIRQLSCSALIAETIRRLNANDSLQPLST